MSKAFGPGWTTNEVTTDSLQLDAKNPRLTLKEDATQEQIRKALLASEDVFELAHQIVASNGMLPGERIIVVKEGNKNVVLEGNRRTTAAQILRNPTLLSKDQQKRVPQASADLKRRLSKLPADISPDRISAEPILTKRHSERGVKPWSTLANMRRVARYFEEKQSINEVSAILAISRARVTQLLRGYALLRVAQRAPGWAEEEKKQLNDPKLITSGFTRFFTLKDARIKLGLNFNENMEPISGKFKDKLNAELQRIARGFLIKDAHGQTAFNTRSTPAQVLDGAPPNKSASQKTKSPTSIKTPNASVFFEKLECKVDNDPLIKFCNELRQVDHQRMPISATMLFRSTLELALEYQLKKKEKWSSLVEKNKGRDPTLTQMFSYCSQRTNSVFAETRISSLFANQRIKDAKEYLDAVVHGRWVTADSNELERTANLFRAALTAVLADTQ